MSDRRVLVYGASGHGKVVADAAAAAGFVLLGFVDDDEYKRGSRLLGTSVVAIGFEELSDLCARESAEVALGVGTNAARRSLFERLEAASIPIATIIHPSAVISRAARVGVGTVVFANATVNPDSVLGRNVIVNTSASVDHDSHIDDHAHLSPGVHLGGTVQIGAGTHVGVGASVRNNVAIGSWSIVGAGAVVVRDVPDRVVCYGNPARVARSIEE